MLKRSSPALAAGTLGFVPSHGTGVVPAVGDGS